MFKLSQRSRRKLEGVHSDLCLVVSRALLYSPVDFGITEGLRSATRQAYLVSVGRSKTIKSKHLRGRAVDIVCYVDGQVTWKLDYYRDATDAFKRAAKELGIGIRCGIDWESFVDGPHIELIEV